MLSLGRTPLSRAARFTECAAACRAAAARAATSSPDRQKIFSHVPGAWLLHPASEVAFAFRSDRRLTALKQVSSDAASAGRSDARGRRGLLPVGSHTYQRPAAWHGTDYTALLGVAAVSVAIGIVSTLVGVKFGKGVDSERQDLQLRREEVSLQLQPEKDDAWSEPATYVAPTP